MPNFTIKNIEVQEGLTRQQVDAEISALLNNPVAKEAGKLVIGVILAKALDLFVNLIVSLIQKVRKPRNKAAEEVAVTTAEPVVLSYWAEEDLSSNMRLLLDILRQHNIPYTIGYKSFSFGEEKEMNVSMTESQDNSKYRMVITKKDADEDSAEYSTLAGMWPYLHGFIEGYIVE